MIRAPCPPFVRRRKADSGRSANLLAHNRDPVDQTMVAARSAVEEIRLGMTELRAEPWKLLGIHQHETAYVIRQATRVMPGGKES